MTYYMLVWLVAIANAASRDGLSELFVHSWPVEGFLSPSKASLNAQVTSMNVVNYACTLSWNHNLFTPEHNSVLYQQFFPERKVVL